MGFSGMFWKGFWEGIGDLVGLYGGGEALAGAQTDNALTKFKVILCTNLR